MHEEALILHHDAIKLVTLQVALYITAFQIQLYHRNILITLAYGAVFMWWADSLSITVIAGGMLGMMVALLSNFMVRMDAFRLSIYGPYYIVLQPLVIYYTITLFIPQTSYPVGYIVCFLLWFLGEMIVLYTGPLYETPGVFFNTGMAATCLVFFVAFWVYHTIYVAVAAGVVFQVIVLFKPIPLSFLK